jgi:hypothetical protein
MDLRSAKVIFSLSKKLWTEIYPSSIFNHLPTTSASVIPSNNGISKIACTLKGVSWILDEYASLVGSHRRICMNLSIISFLCRTRDSSRKILIGFPYPSSFFSSPMGCCQAQCDRYFNGLISSSPSFSCQRKRTLKEDQAG